MSNDNVEHPTHYTAGGIECIDALRSALGEGFVGYLQGNCLKYLWRFQSKGGVEDLQKCRVYLDWLIKEVSVE